MSRDSLATAAVCLAVDARSAELVTMLAREDIPSVLLKGPTLARWLYPNEVRRYRDVDLLVPPDRLPRIGALLGELGYSVSTWDGALSRSQTFAREGSASIDVHRNFHCVDVEPEVFWACVDRDAVPFPLQGVTARAPSLPARALLTALHGVAHARGAQQREDLRRAAGERDVWPEATDLARELDALPGLVAGLRSFPEGDRLADALGLPAVAPDALRLAASNPPSISRGILELVETPTFGARAGLLVRKLGPSRRDMRRKFWLARQGALGMVVAYAVRPLILASRIPRGWRAVRALRSNSD